MMEEIWIFVHHLFFPNVPIEGYLGDCRRLYLFYLLIYLWRRDERDEEMKKRLDTALSDEEERTFILFILEN